LAQYYFHTGRKVEGKYSVTIAIALVLGTNMHRIRSKEPNADDFRQRQPHQWSEETQSINAFWTVLALNSRWAAVEGYGSSFPYWKPAMRIDTPWPWVSYC
ncbi:hypothetical protein K435DRAFT_667348, partial [Dendrothele bispora CBS 962.96]